MATTIGDDAVERERLAAVLDRVRSHSKVARLIVEAAERDVKLQQSHDGRVA